MHILFITRKYPPQVGGMENYSYNLIKHFPDSKKVIKLGKKQYHLFWFIPYSILAGLYFGRQADLIHLGDGLMSITGWVLKKILRKPVVCTLHGLDLTFPNLLYQFYLKIFAKNFDLYICNSRATEKLAQEKKFNPTLVIPVGISLRQQSLDNTPLPHQSKKTFRLLSVGRLVKRKGIYWFIKNVLPKLKNCEYWVVGEGAEKERIKNFITQNIALQPSLKKIKLLGRVSNAELEKIYQQVDLFIMPNIKVKGDLEGFGIVALEAGLHGLPVVASNIEGIQDAITHNQNGYLVQSKNKEEFIQAINQFLADENYRKNFGEKAKRYVIENFSWDKIARKYYTEFKKIINKSHWAKI